MLKSLLTGFAGWAVGVGIATLIIWLSGHWSDSSTTWVLIGVTLGFVCGLSGYCTGFLIGFKRWG